MGVRASVIHRFWASETTVPETRESPALSRLRRVSFPERQNDFTYHTTSHCNDQTEDNEWRRHGLLVTNPKTIAAHAPTALLAVIHEFALRGVTFAASVVAPGRLHSPHDKPGLAIASRRISIYVWIALSLDAKESGIRGSRERTIFRVTY